MGAATAAETVPGGYLCMAFLASLVFALASLALPHGALSLRVALLLLAASSCRFILSSSPLRTMYAKEWCSHLFAWDLE